MVPADLKQRVWATYRPGQEQDKRPSVDYLKVVREAINAVRVAEGRRKWRAMDGPRPMVTSMLALTIWQPWAAAIVYGPKRIENRTWTPRLNSLPKRIAIHAGKLDLEAFDIIHELWPAVARLWPQSDHHHFVCGALLATATLTRVVTLDEVEDDPWACGPWCWVLEDVTPLDKPVVARGFPGLWHTDALGDGGGP